MRIFVALAALLASKVTSKGLPDFLQQIQEREDAADKKFHEESNRILRKVERVRKAAHLPPIIQAPKGLTDIAKTDDEDSDE
jgi:hypothetical protein